VRGRFAGFGWPATRTQGRKPTVESKKISRPVLKLRPMSKSGRNKTRLSDTFFGFFLVNSPAEIYKIKYPQKTLAARKTSGRG
jgi:hypothetical protein